MEKIEFQLLTQFLCYIFFLVCLLFYFILFYFLNIACFTYLFMGVIFLKYKFRSFYFFLVEVELYLIMRKNLRVYCFACCSYIISYYCQPVNTGCLFFFFWEIKGRKQKHRVSLLGRESARTEYNVYLSNPTIPNTPPCPPATPMFMIFCDALSCPPVDQHNHQSLV